MQTFWIVADYVVALALLLLIPIMPSVVGFVMVLTLGAFSILIVGPSIERIVARITLHTFIRVLIAMSTMTLGWTSIGIVMLFLGVTFINIFWAGNKELA